MLEEGAAEEDLGPPVSLEAVKAAVRAMDRATMEDMMERMKAMAAEAREAGGGGSDGGSDGGKDDLTRKLAAELGDKIRQSMVASDSSQLVWKFFVFAFVVAVLFGVLVFFGYKLYRSLTDKERKREEKRKLKQQKKKK